MKHKTKKFLAIIMACTLLFGTVNVFAYGTPFNFALTTKRDHQHSDYYAKEDNDPTAYVTLMNTAYTNFKSGSVLKVNVHKKSTKTQVTYDLKFKEITNQHVDYKKAQNAKKGTKYYLEGSVDATSQYSTIDVQGIWLP